MIIPKTKNSFVIFLLLYLIEFTSNSVKEICIIIPAVEDNSIPRILLVIIVDKNKYVIIAPNNSDNPDIRVLVKALILLFVE